MIVSVEDREMNEMEMKETSISMPPEILAQIARACVQSYDLKIYQNKFFVHKDQEDICLAFEIPPDEQLVRKISNTGEAAYNKGCKDDPDYDTRILISNFTSSAPKRFDFEVSCALDTLYGFPDVRNLKSVSKLFYHEITLAIKDRFTGKIYIEREGSSRDPLRWRQFRPYQSICEASNFAWIKPLITEITLFDKGYWNFDNSILGASESPNLRKMNLSLFKLVNRFEAQELLRSSKVGVIRVMERIVGLQMRNMVNLVALRQRKVDIKIDFATLATYVRPSDVYNPLKWATGFPRLLWTVNLPCVGGSTVDIEEEEQLTLADVDAFEQISAGM